MAVHHGGLNWYGTGIDDFRKRAFLETRPLSAEALFDSIMDATADELMLIPGIGPAMAQRIVEGLAERVVDIELLRQHVQLFMEVRCCVFPLGFITDDFGNDHEVRLIVPQDRRFRTHVEATPL